MSLMPPHPNPYLICDNISGASKLHEHDLNPAFVHAQLISDRVHGRLVQKDKQFFLIRKAKDGFTEVARERIAGRWAHWDIVFRAQGWTFEQAEAWVRL